MKEKYVKPEVELIEFSLTQSIANGACVSRKEDFEGMVTFTDTSDCADGVTVETYCYFTSTNELFAS